jgi:hypothetical protein
MAEDYDFPDELDPVDKARLQEQYEAEIEQSMRYAYGQIHDMGIENWIRLVNFDPNKKMRILENMINWHARPDIEEYEKAAELLKGLNKLKQSK